MKTHFVACLIVACSASLHAGSPAGKTQQLTTPDQVPEGLAKSDWASIRAAYEAGRHAFMPIESGWQARNPGQQWTTKFDGRGFLTSPKDGGWSWGLELESGGDTPVSTAAHATDKSGRPTLTFPRSTAITEWFINDQRGLEQGWTLSAPAEIRLRVRGSLRPSVSAQSISFGGQLTYAGLKAWDATGKVIPTHFEATEEGFAVRYDDTAAQYPLTIDPIAQQAYLKASQVTAGDDFGISVAVSGDTVVVGAPGEDSSTTGINSTPNEGASQAGAAYVFVRSSGTWSQQAYLKASQVTAGDEFGFSVAVSGDTVVVGAHGEDSSTTGINSTPNEGATYAGAAYVFVRSGTTWSQQAYLKGNQVTASDSFGYSVAVSGGTVVVGALGEDSSTTGINSTPNEAFGLYGNAGAAYVFVRSSGTWSQQAYLKASQVSAGDYFGWSVAVSEDTVVVGAYGEDSSTTGINSTPNENTLDAGAAYVFVRSGAAWSQQAYLKASQVTAGDWFGYSVAVSGDTVVVGALTEDSSTTGINSTPNELANNAGAAYVFVRSGMTWSQEAYLKASQVNGYDHFGVSVAVSGETVVVGAHYAGAAYVFVRNGVAWIQQAYLQASQVSAGDSFGYSVAVSGGTVVVGDLGEDSSTTGINSTPNEGANSAGAAYIFSGLGPTPDIAVTQAAAVADAGSIDFGSVTLGSSSAPLTFTITNPGTADLTGLAVTGGTSEFTVSALSATTVTPGGLGATFTVTFTPSVTGPRTTTLQIASNVTGTKIPYDITLTGIGEVPPTLSPVAIASNNANTGRAKMANTVTLSFTASEAIQAPSVTLLGVNATVANPSGNNWTATATVGAGTVEGLATFSISASDLANNAAPVVTSTTNSSSVTVDKTLPGLTSVIIASNNTNTARAKLANKVTLSFTANEAIQTPSVTLLGVAATVANPSGNNWTATATVGAGTAEGVAVFSISASDLAGNATSATVTTNSSSVTVDKTLPTLTAVTIASNNANTGRAKLANTVTLSFTANEAIQTPSVTLLGVAATIANPSGNNWTATAAVVADTAEGSVGFSITATDLAGNAASAVTTTTNASSVTVDKTLPGLTSVTIASNNTDTARAKLGNTVTLSFTTNEAIQTPSVTLLGVTATVANPSGNNWTASAAVVVDTAEGLAAFSISASDLASNTAADATTTTDASSVMVDKTGPTLVLPSDIAVDTKNLNGVAVNFTVTATDALDPAPTVSATPASGSIFPIGTTTVNVTTTDAVGNSSPGSFKVTVTRITPEIVVQDSAGTNLVSGSSMVDFGASGAGGSVSKIFTVRNTSTYQLTGLGITIDNTADFAVTAPPATPVLPGESTTFTVKFQPGTLGAASTVLHLTSNDDDEPSFEFALIGRSHSLSFNENGLAQREDAVTIKVPVQLSSAFGAAFSVPFTVGGTATTADYTISTPTPIKFTATQTVAYISIRIKDDLIEEGDESLILTLGAPSFASVTVVSPSVFTLTITEDDVMPVIAPLLVSQIVAVGDSVSFPSGATGSGPQALVWKKNGIVIPGETMGTYGFSPAKLTHGAAYSITATNQRGSVSSTAQLAVVDRSDAIIRANVGSSPSLTVNATGNALIYHWRDANGDLPISSAKYAGVTTKTLTVKKAVLGDTGRYTCRVTAPGGSMISGDRYLQVPSQKPIAKTPAFPNVVAFNSFSYQLTFDPDPTRAPTKFVCASLPKGMTCNATTGLISGIPTQTGDFTVLVTLSNSAGAADTVQGTFSVFKYPAGAVGAYAGVMGRDTKANSSLGGRIDLTTTITGGYTGTLRLGAIAYPLKGTLRTAPTAGAHPGVSLTIVRSKQLPVLLVLDLDPATNDLTGTVSEQGSTTNAMIVGWRNVWHTTATPTANPVVGQLGAHSFKIDPATTGPQGYGYGTVKVTNTGGTTVGGRTADGEVIATTGVLGPDGEVLVYSILYSSKGSILGTMGIDSDANHSIDSQLDWQKTQATTARDYAPFGPMNVTVQGGKYSVTAPVLSLPPLSVIVTDNAQFTFSDAGVPSATNPNMKLRISNTNVLTLNPTNPGKINSLVFTPATGAFGGKMTLTDPPALPRTVAFQGWLVPTLGKGYGYFLLPQLANPLATPPTSATTSPILSGKVLLEAMTR